MSQTVHYLIPDKKSLAEVITRFRHDVQQGLLGGPVHITVGRPTRTLKQNKKLWSMLTDLSRQVNWYGENLTPEEWKDVMTAGLKKQHAVPGIDGGFVVLGAHTHDMSKEECSDLIELIYAFGAEQQVSWSEAASRGPMKSRGDQGNG